MKAEEFISHEEVLASLEYADANKDNVELIDSIIEKAKLKITRLFGEDVAIKVT